MARFIETIVSMKVAIVFFLFIKTKVEIKKATLLLTIVCSYVAQTGFKGDFPLPTILVDSVNLVVGY